jgi:hypothetical protein
MCWCDWRSCHNRGGILDTSKKIQGKILGCTGLLIGCHGIPLWFDRDHDLVALFGTLGFECECLLFPADVELYGASCNINRGSSGTQDGWMSSDTTHSWEVILKYQSPHARKNSLFSPGYLPWFPLKAKSIDPPVADAGK